jgi:hypothetical protein
MRVVRMCPQQVVVSESWFRRSVLTQWVLYCAISCENKAALRFQLRHGRGPARPAPSSLCLPAHEVSRGIQLPGGEASSRTFVCFMAKNPTVPRHDCAGGGETVSVHEIRGTAQYVRTVQKASELEQEQKKKDFVKKQKMYVRTAREKILKTYIRAYFREDLQAAGKKRRDFGLQIWGALHPDSFGAPRGLSPTSAVMRRWHLSGSVRRHSSRRR